MISLKQFMDQQAYLEPHQWCNG